MKLAILALLLSAACSSCAHNVGDPFLAPPQDRSVYVFTPEGFGRGCPVDGLIVTARHLVKIAGPFPGSYNASWSDNYGHSGYATTVFVNNFQDVAGLTVNGPQYPVEARIARSKVKEEVFWYEYDYVDDPMRSTLRRAILTRRVGRHLILSEAPNDGASGGCVFNQKGEAIGIIVWRLPFEESEDVGIGLQFPEEWL